ncbi:hypothetical protein H8356DRAFT_1340488 [Neocallimastix lanati (nom. inval.)]|nr:hypothetical protein H8356DRAFT_1340488 [Neocallimastix sp. JGI-2020a]
MIYLIEILLKKYLTDCDRIIDLLDLESIKRKNMILKSDDLKQENGKCLIITAFDDMMYYTDEISIFDYLLKYGMTVTFMLKQNIPINVDEFSPFIIMIKLRFTPSKFSQSYAKNLASFCKNTSKYYHLYIIITVLNLPNLDIYQQYGFYNKYMQKCYDFKPRKHTKNPEKIEHGTQWNCVDLSRLVGSEQM